MARNSRKSFSQIVQRNFRSISIHFEAVISRHFFFTQSDYLISPFPFEYRLQN